MIINPSKPRIRNPGRRALAAETYAFVPRMDLERAFINNTEYRKLRHAVDTTDAAVRQMSRVGGHRAAAAQQRAIRAANACAAWLLRHLSAVPETEAAPVVLTRELDADGTLVSETERAVSGSGPTQ